METCGKRVLETSLPFTNISSCTNHKCLHISYICPVLTWQESATHPEQRPSPGEKALGRKDKCPTHRKNGPVLIQNVGSKRFEKENRGPAFLLVKKIPSIRRPNKPHAHADLWVFRDLQDPFRSEFRGISSMQKFAPLGRGFFDLQRSAESRVQCLTLLPSGHQAWQAWPENQPLSLMISP